MILEIFFKDPDPDPPDPWPKDPQSVGSGLKTHGSPTLEKSNKYIYAYFLFLICRYLSQQIFTQYFNYVF